MDDYDFEMNRILREIRKNNAKLIGLQFPDGLKGYAVDIGREIEEKTMAKAIILIDPTYGACDRKEKISNLLNLDFVIHFGHTGLGFDE